MARPWDILRSGHFTVYLLNTLYIETNDSLRIAQTILELLEGDKKYEDIYLNCLIAIHVDAGNSKNGRTWELIPELVGWVRAMGFTLLYILKPLREQYTPYSASALRVLKR